MFSILFYDFSRTFFVWQKESIIHALIANWILPFYLLITSLFHPLVLLLLNNWFWRNKNSRSASVKRYIRKGRGINSLRPHAPAGRIASGFVRRTSLHNCFIRFFKTCGRNKLAPLRTCRSGRVCTSVLLKFFICLYFCTPKMLYIIKGVIVNNC